MAKVTIKNTARGLRGVNTDNGLVYIEPGATETLDVSGKELESARSRSYFEFDGKAAEADTDDSEQGDGLDDLRTAELEKLIADEGVTLPENGSGSGGRIVNDDRVAAIRAAREAKANPDELDGMDDETLRNTVTAITGTEPPADADRDALLGLARGATGS